MTRRFKDLSGLRFGRLVAVEYVGKNPHKKSIWSCVCDCGNTTEVVSGQLSSGRTKSCGCLSADSAKQRMTTHGMTGTPEYRAWSNARDRCHNPSNPRYCDWGGRGIAMCDEWLEDFPSFYAEVGRKPTPRHTLDRIDNSRGYEPGNVRWATVAEQNANQRKRKDNKSGVRGVYRHGATGKWAAQIRRNRKCYHLGLFADMALAVRARQQAEMLL